MRPLVKATLYVIWGSLYCKWLIRKHGKDSHIFLIRGKTGDIYLYFRFLKNYLVQNSITNYVIIGDGKNLVQIAKLYPYVTDKIFPLSERKGLALQRLWGFLGEKKINLHLSLMWDWDLLYNRCAVRLTMPFNFIDSYYWFLFKLNRSESVPIKANFSPITSTRIADLENKGFSKGKTVVLSPVAYCVRPISPDFWNLLSNDLEKRGYKTLVMLGQNENNLFTPPRYFFPYEESVPILEWAGHFIGLRSGFCDIISEAKCNKVILYPELPKHFDGSVHRADIYYSSFKAMELSDDSFEISFPGARDVLNFEPQEENIDKYIGEMKKTVQEVLCRFPMIL